ncbi:protein pinocchio [Lycorma delicatula]|uniref:protein pinocchio n=1 Tax=Lycorma delicatula TaxID=130591 RepID=UPI003F51A3A0
MSLASVHPSAGLSHRSQSFGSVSSLDDLHNSCYSSASEAVLSIEELKLQLNSCFTCGVSWYEDHVSLDCAECGGYSLERPCPLCDGQCSSTWKRDLTMSHACGKARWEGECQMLKPITSEDESRLCKRLEKLAASS